jgi:hypothetical protein
LSSDRGNLPTPVAAEQTTDRPSRTKGNTRTSSRAADAAQEPAGGGAYACWQTAARRLVRRERGEGLKLVERAAAAVEAGEWPATQRADSLLGACAIADPGRGGARA